MATTEVPSAMEKRQAKKPVRPVLSSRKTTQGRSAPMLSERSMGETYANTEREVQEHPTLSVNWEAIHNSPGLVKSENYSFECDSSSPVVAEFRNDPWASPHGYLASSTLSEWTNSGYGMGGQVAEVPLMHDCGSAMSVEQMTPGTEVMVADNTFYDPGNFHTADHWGFYNEGM